MLDTRAKKIIAFLKEKLAEETEPSRNMLKTYSDYIKDEATEEDLEKAKWYLEKLIKKEKYQELDEIEKRVGGTI